MSPFYNVNDFRNLIQEILLPVFWNLYLYIRRESYHELKMWMSEWIIKLLDQHSEQSKYRAFTKIANWNSWYRKSQRNFPMEEMMDQELSQEFNRITLFPINQFSWGKERMKFTSGNIGQSETKQDLKESFFGFWILSCLGIYF